MCLRLIRKRDGEKKYFFLASLKLLKKRVGSGVGSGSISQRYRSGPAPNVTDPRFPNTGNYHNEMLVPGWYYMHYYTVYNQSMGFLFSL
jgi:hypothetical protein